MFCVVCGKEWPLDQLRHGTCPSCYVEKTTLASVRDHVDVEVCVHCHSRKRGEVWVEGHGAMEPIVSDAVREAVQLAKVVERPRMDIDVIPEDERNFTVHARVAGVAEGVPFESKLSTRSRIKNATCVRCSRVQGGYYEAIVQVRTSRREMPLPEKRAIKAIASRFIDRIVQDGDRNAFVLRDEDAERGLDVYMGTTNSGRMLAKTIATEFGGKVTEHAKTVGQKDGLDLIRMTFAVRLPEYRAGDVVIVQDHPGIVSSIGAKTVQVLDLRTGRLRHVERADVERATVLSRGDARDAVVVSQTATELQVLDPWTYATVPVLKPAGLERVGATVPVLRHEGELLVLPDARAEDA
jgi:nonsense-mediated mRNA decay protein 3